MNLTDKARKGNREAMESLFDMTKINVMHLSCLLLDNEKTASVILPRIYRNLWDQVLSGRITTEEDFAQAAILKTAAFCKAAIAKKDGKAFRIPANRDFVQGIGEDVVVRSKEWETVLGNLPPLHRFFYVLAGSWGFTASQLAKLFHTNEETVQMALQAESTNLNRILAAASRKSGKELTLTVEQFHRALDNKRTGTEVPPSVDQTVLLTINALCEPIQKKLRKKRKRIAVTIGAVVLVVCVAGGAVLAAVTGKEEEAEAEEASSTSSLASTTESTVESTTESSTVSSESDSASQESSQEETSTDVDVNATAYADIEIQDYGTITVALDGDAAPETVENFISLAESGFYDGLTFHRIIDGFMMQGGDPNGDGTGGSDETIYGEFSGNGFDNPLSHTRGAISMARSDDYDSASSQFFIVQEDSTYLDGEYAVFGYVTEGMDIVDEICESAQPTDDNGTIPAEEQPVIVSVTIRDVEEEAA